MTVRPWFLFALCFSVMLFAGRSHADVQAPMFPKWAAVSPQNILDPVPEIISISLPGAVSPKNHVKPEIVGCPVVEGGKTVAWSMSCFFSALRGGIREKL